MRFSSSRVTIAGMKINSVGKGCSVTFSQKKISGHRVAHKRSEGFGEENADGCVHLNPISTVDDADVFDCFDERELTRY